MAFNPRSAEYPDFRIDAIRYISDVNSPLLHHSFKHSFSHLPISSPLCVNFQPHFFNCVHFHAHFPRCVYFSALSTISSMFLR